MKKKASVNGVRNVLAALDDMANVMQFHHESLGIPAKYATDMAYRCDVMASFLEGQSKKGFFNPALIGQEVSGPAVMDPNNPFMAGHFKQNKFTQLEQKQVSGQLAQNAASHIADPEIATAVRVATEAVIAGVLAGYTKKAEEETPKAPEAPAAPAPEAPKVEASKAPAAPVEQDEACAKEASEKFSLFSN